MTSVVLVRIFRSIFLISVIIVTGIFFFSFSKSSEAVSDSKFVEKTDAGFIVPACGSSGANFTCVGANPYVTFDWAADAGACTTGVNINVDTIGVLSPSNLPCTGSYSWTSPFVSNTSYTYQVFADATLTGKTVDSVGNVGQYSSIAVSGSNVYISYYDASTGRNDLKFAKSTDNGDTWLAGNIKTVDSVGNVGQYSSIAVSGSNVFISYRDSTNTNLKFAKSTDNGDTWLAGNIKTVDSVGNVGQYSSIAVSGSNVFISYRDSTNTNLKF